MKFNLRIITIFIFLIFLSQGYSQDSINQYKALRLKNELGFQKSYRVLKTTFKSLEGFQTFYPGTKITLEKILRYHFYTAIHINQKENKLFSMDLTEFKLKNNTSEEEITKETVALIGDMFFGSNELKIIPIKN
ncbi:hypothetical protein N9392_01090 [Flavobacteriaceae bacterium]|jgi:hypothetical protein|nr:hypothetical protein [Flavobacteriaceae bacterium]